jgi:integrase
MLHGSTGRPQRPAPRPRLTQQRPDWQIGARWLVGDTSVHIACVHFHDLRHAGNQFSAEAGANLRELMERMGHDSTRAASIYLHSSAERQRAIADQVSRNAKKALGKSKQSGTGMACRLSKKGDKA